MKGHDSGTTTIMTTIKPAVTTDQMVKPTVKETDLDTVQSNEASTKQYPYKAMVKNGSVSPKLLTEDMSCKLNVPLMKLVSSAKPVLATNKKQHTSTAPATDVTESGPPAPMPAPSPAPHSSVSTSRGFSCA